MDEGAGECSFVGLVKRWEDLKLLPVTKSQGRIPRHSLFYLNEPIKELVYSKSQ